MRASIPYGAYWTSPFARWQGSLAGRHALELGAETARAFLQSRGIGPGVLDGVVLGSTVPQRQGFYGPPWVAALLGEPGLGGPHVAQACATSARMVAVATAEIATGARQALLLVAADRTSNGPHMTWPDPAAPGGRPRAEDPVWDSFMSDPWAGCSMAETAERVASENGIGREEQEEMTLLRTEQYRRAIADDRAFQRRTMVPVEIRQGRKATGSLDTDEGVFPTTQEGLRALRPVLEGGTVTHGTQTHPADGNAGMIVCSPDHAAELSRDPAIAVSVLGWGEARVGKGLMPTAPVPAARRALAHAGVGLDQVASVTTHNPFAVNDCYFAKETGFPAERTNRWGSSLVWGHPQGPTGLRAMAELIEDLASAGGGIGLFTGCAAGDTAMAVVVKVG